MLKFLKIKAAGFTIVELLIVIVVIGGLASVTVVAYSGVQSRAQAAKMKADLSELSKAIQLARLASSKTTGQITGSYWTAGNCMTLATGTDFAALDHSTSSCWVGYRNMLNIISNLSGVNVRNMVDPWGRPYSLDENEGEGGDCSGDTIGVYANPYVNYLEGTSNYPGYPISIPLSGYSGCAI